MKNSYYIRGFMDKIAEYEKSAKYGYEMTDAERRAATVAEKRYQDEQNKKILKRNTPDPELPPFAPIKDTLLHSAKQLGRRLNSHGRALASAAGVTALRGVQNAADLALWIPKTVDSVLFGKLGKVDYGRGLLGRHIGRFNRFIDRQVHNARSFSEDYDYANNIDSGVNRFLHGAAADAAGAFLGFGGLGGLAASGTKRILPLVFGATAIPATLSGGKEKQLRDREAYLRTIDPRYRIYLDPTSTPENQMNAPTPEEFRRYHTPYGVGIPTSWTGRINVPGSWSTQADGTPVQFRDYGT